MTQPTEPTEPTQPSDATGWTDLAGSIDPPVPGEQPAGRDVPGAPAPPDGRSFSERFRGTEWDAAPPVTAPSPEAERRRRGSRVFLVLGVALLAGTVLTALVLDAGGRLDLIPGLGPTPTDTLPRAPSETTDPVVAAATIEAFISVVTNPRLSYEIRERGSIESGAFSGATLLTGEVSGRDADATFNMTTTSGTTVSGRMIIKGRTVWLQRTGEKAWRKSAPRPGEMPRVDAFDGIDDPGDLAYVGREMRRGSLTHHLVTTAGWLPPNAGDAVAAIPGLHIGEARLDLWVLDDGRPFEAVYAARASAGGPLATATAGGPLATATAGGPLATATINEAYRFSNVGGKITIKAPKQP